MLVISTLVKHYKVSCLAKKKKIMKEKEDQYCCLLVAQVIKLKTVKLCRVDADLSGQSSGFIF